jgi:16S rRNA G966 N2-methylase RsmD
MDLCCGSGALGLEFLGSGASHVTFVDSSPGAIAFVRETLSGFGAATGFELRCCDVRRLDWESLPAADLVFMDPPYGDAVLYSWAGSRDWPAIVSRGGYVFVEAGPGDSPGDGWERRAYGESVLFWQEIG